MKQLIYILILIPGFLVAQPGPDLNNRLLRSSGFIAYEDTSGTTATLLAGDTIILSLNPDLIEQRNRPIDMPILYQESDSTNVGKNGCAFEIVVQIEITQESPNETKTSFWFNIGGGIPPLYETGATLTKGNGLTTPVNKSTGIYTLGTWEANGGSLYITSNQDVSVEWRRIIQYKIHDGYTASPFTN